MGILRLAIAHAWYHRGQTLTLLAALVLLGYLPLAVAWLTGRFQQELMDRATRTPLVLGMRGSRYDLVLHTLYFEGRVPRAIPMHAFDEVAGHGDALAIPILAQHRARGFAVVGTTLDYFNFRNLVIAEGTTFGRLGDCVLGANVAERLKGSGVILGDHVMTDPTNVFDIAGAYPLNLRIVGRLAPSYSADDDAIFVDLKSAWIIEGIGHGHQDLATAPAEAVLDADRNIANAALPQFTEITDENIDSFHFHGDPADFPLTGVLLDPVDDKATALLAGRYVQADAPWQILRPRDVVEEILSLVLRVKRFFDLQTFLVTVALTLLLGVIILLSVRLREGEMQTIFKIGCGRGTQMLLIGMQWSIILALSAAMVAVLLTFTVQYASPLLRRLLF